MRDSQETVALAGLSVPVFRFNTVVVGSGAAGLNAAEYLLGHGQPDVALVTEGLKMGTSRNTGSDKQTYYKLSLAGGGADSVRQTAQTLFDGAAMDGDIALAEAACSAQCFYRLVDLGVPFPHNAFGEFVGYKTDHDPRQRGTSCGPLTSKFMTERLAKAAMDRGLDIFDRCQAVEVLVAPDGDGKKIAGLLAINLDGLDDPNRRYALFIATNVVYATGGEAGMYELSVYPTSQTGSTGAAFRAGVRGKNLTESQYGITSTKFRWNLSGTYQQVLPRYLSTDGDGGDEREFLDSHFTGAGAMLEAIFLKGYQWPFDPRKIAGGGSSLIDILVYNEIMFKGRRVFLDYTRNPSRAEVDGRLDVPLLTPVVREYLENSGALLATPIERLEQMNPAAIELYRSHDIDLKSETLEIAVSAQHNNGGLAADAWWQSDVAGFFPVGEVNGSHGVYRPGGSALNSGQVGGLRASQYILNRRMRPPPPADAALAACRERAESAVRYGEDALARGETLDIKAELAALRRRMSRHGAHIRSPEGVGEALGEARNLLSRLHTAAGIAEPARLRDLHQLRDLAVCHFVYLSAIGDFMEKGGGSRGSYLIQDPDGDLPHPSLPAAFRYRLDDGGLGGTIQETVFEDGECRTEWRRVRPIPADDNWFETVWKQYRNGDIYDA